MAEAFKAIGADGYDRIMGRISVRLATPFIVFAGRTPGERILDVGCGTGSLTFALSGFGDHAEIVGVDIGEPFLAAARDRNTDPRTSFRVASATSLPFPDGHFDRALSQLVLQFVPDSLAAVYEMRRVVRPGGTVSACVWDAYGGQPHIRMIWDAAAVLGLIGTHAIIRPLSTEGEMAALWQRAGLTDVIESEISMRFAFEDFDDYWSPYLTGNGPLGEMVMSLTARQRATLEERMRFVYLSGRPDGRRSFVSTAWVCKGTVPG
ncbi:class I SAM-dependent methyltransferase [Reyranella sp.]|uniref:class I SAM-dependent methyltransferase n=1 Tax=Reyranella sp. TaxID=1929291 RepID=UPI003D0EE541